MNVFYEYESIFGKTETVYLDRTMQEFFEIATAIRNRLGKQGYLLDQYLSFVLAAVKSNRDSRL